MFQPREPGQRFPGAGTAHFLRWHELAAHGRTPGLAKDTATVGGVELQATHASRFAAGHAGNGGADGRGDAAGTTAKAAGDYRHSKATKIIANNDRMTMGLWYFCS
jgi:hypothetical protein